MKGARFGLVTAAAVIAAFSTATAMSAATAEFQVIAVGILAVVFGGFGALAASE